MKIIVQLLLAFTISSAVSGQSYHQLIENGKTWNILTMTMGPWYTSSYSFDGDTIINNFTYQKLRSVDKFSSSGYYLGAMREDTILQQVFYRDMYMTEDGLLYDFSLQQGDTVSIISNTGMKGFSLLYSVDSLDQVPDENGALRKRMYMSANMNNSGEVWVEGVGSSQGLISPGNWSYMADLNWSLLCSKRDGEVVYYNPLLDTCYIDYVGIPKINSGATAIHISPNPVADVSVLQFTNNINDCFILEIYSLMGQLLRRETSTGNQFYIYNKDYSNGLYFFKLIGPDKEFATGKFIVR
jgi:hypothetical protein